MDPIFILDLRDGPTGKQVAVRVTKQDALLPLGALIARVLRTAPDNLLHARSLATEDADTFFRIQDLIFPVDDHGELGAAPYTGLIWRHQRDGFAYDPARPALFERVRRLGEPDLLVLPLEADRHGLAYERTWRGFHARRWQRFKSLATPLLEDALPGGVLLAGAADKRRFAEAVAHRIWLTDFENYSRFLPPMIRLKTGDETMENIAAGRGGVCTEKVLALKFITDAFGLDSRIVFAGPHTRAPLPVDELRVMLDELADYDFTYARRYMRYWDHVALEYTFTDGTHWLLDPSNGNIPFISAPAGRYLDVTPERQSVPVRMLAVEEPVTYHRISEKLGLDFMFAWETWVADVDLMQVFDNKLGLLVADQFYVTPAVSGSATKRAIAIDGWRTYAAKHNLGFGLDSASTGAPPAHEGEAATFHAFRTLCPAQAAYCAAALDGLARRYRQHILTHHGIDKPFHADLIVLDRRKLIGRQEPAGNSQERALTPDRSPAGAEEGSLEPGNAAKIKAPPLPSRRERGSGGEGRPDSRLPTPHSPHRYAS